MSIRESIRQLFRTGREMPSNTSVSLAGEFIPNFAAASAVSGVMMEKPSIGEHLSDSYIEGPGNRLKRFNRYANRKYKTKIGYNVTCATRWDRNFEAAKEAIIQAFEEEGAFIKYIHEDIITERDAAMRWIAQHHPDRVRQNFGLSVRGNKMTVTWPDHKTVTFPTPTGDDAPGRLVLVIGYLVSLYPEDSFVVPDIVQETLYEDSGIEDGHTKTVQSIPWGTRPPEGFEQIALSVAPAWVKAILELFAATYKDYEYELYYKQETITKWIGGRNRDYLKQEFWGRARGVLRAINVEGDPATIWAVNAVLQVMETPLTQDLWGEVKEAVFPIALPSSDTWSSADFLPPIPVRVGYRMLEDSEQRALITSAKAAAFRATSARMKTFSKFIKENLNEWQRSMNKDELVVPENEEEELDNLAAAVDPEKSSEEPRDITPEEARETVERGSMVSLLESAYLEFGLGLNNLDSKEDVLYLGRFFKMLADYATSRASEEALKAEQEVLDEAAELDQKLLIGLENSYEEWMKRELLDTGIGDPLSAFFGWMNAEKAALKALSQYNQLPVYPEHTLTFIADRLQYSQTIRWASMGVTSYPNKSGLPVGDYSIECGYADSNKVTQQGNENNDLNILWRFSRNSGSKDLDIIDELQFWADPEKEIKFVGNDIRFRYVDSKDTIVVLSIRNLTFVDRVRGTEVTGVKALWEKKGAANPFVIPVYMPAFNSLGMKRKTQVALNCTNMRMHYRTVYIDTYLETFLLRPIEFLSILASSLMFPGGALMYALAETEQERAAILRASQFMNPTAILTNIVVSLMVRGLQGIFGKKWGAVIGVVLMTGLMALGGGMGVWSIINAVISATTAGIQRYYEESARESQEALQRYMEELEEGWKELLGSSEENSKKDFYGEVMVTSLQARRPETPMEFLTMSFLSGDDIAQLGAKYIEHYTELSLDLKREVSF